MKSSKAWLQRVNAVSDNLKVVQKVREEFAKFERTMEELYLLRCVAEDLKSYRRMIKLKRYD
jgi:hypothetical protein